MAGVKFGRGGVGLPPDEGGPLAAAGGRIAGPGAGETLEGDDPDGSLGALDLGGGELVERELAFDKEGGPFGEIDGAGAGE
mgnify:CR=1 FL=1